MLENGNKINCGFSDEIVSYLYDEVGASERTRFETHLANCALCTDEFAAVSNARFSVYEWRREEFADLPTPQIVIPYPPKRNDEESVSVGLLAGLRGWLNFPVAVAAGLVLCLGLGFFALRYLGSVEQPIASNIKNIPPNETHNPPAVATTTEVKQPDVAVGTVTLPTVRPSSEVRPVKAVEYRRPRGEKQLTARNAVNRNAAQNISNAPILSENNEEADDNSLRLSDLFADVDG